MAGIDQNTRQPANGLGYDAEKDLYYAISPGGVRMWISPASFAGQATGTGHGQDRALQSNNGGFARTSDQWNTLTGQVEKGGFLGSPLSILAIGGGAATGLGLAGAFGGAAAGAGTGAASTAGATTAGLVPTTGLVGGSSAFGAGTVGAATGATSMSIPWGTILGKAFDVGSNVYSANKQANTSQQVAQTQTEAANKAAEIQATSARYAADLQAKAAAEALAFQQAEADRAFRSKQAAEQANYQQWFARQNAIKNYASTLGMQIDIPPYVPLGEQTGQTGPTQQTANVTDRTSTVTGTPPPNTVSAGPAAAPIRGNTLGLQANTLGAMVSSVAPTTQAPDAIQMRAPTGEIALVPRAKVPFYQSRGAQLMGA